MSETTLLRRKAIMDQLAGFQLRPRIVAPPPTKPGSVISVAAAKPGVKTKTAFINNAARTGEGRSIPEKLATEDMPAEIAAPKRARMSPSRVRCKQAYNRRRRALLRKAIELHKAETTALRVVLMERYPAAFSVPPRPLKIGIDRDIAADLVCDAEILALTMYQWTRHPHYLTALRGGGPRFGLDGSEQGEVSEEDRTTNTRHCALVPALRDCPRQTERGEDPAGPR
jgi:ProQ/FINO family